MADRERGTVNIPPSQTKPIIRISTTQSLLPTWQQLPRPFQASMAPVLAEYRAYLHGEADTSWARRLLGELHEHLGEQEQALAAYRDCIAFDPYHVPAIERLVALYEANAQWPQAEAVLKSALAWQPRQAQLHHLTSRLHLQQGNLKQALHHAREARQSAPTDASMLEDYAALLVQHAPEVVQNVFQRNTDRALVTALCRKLPEAKAPTFCRL